MFAKSKLFFIAITLISCDFRSEGYDKNMTDKYEKEMSLMNRHSGYYYQPGMWRGFARCWLQEKAKLNDVEFYGLDESEIVKAENRLNMKLPASYRNFISEINISKDHSRKVNSILYGLFSIYEIKMLKDYDGEMIHEYGRYPIESTDENYFRYGTEQDDSSSRYSNFKESIVVGKYSQDSFAYILLYPTSKTSDDEMEAALIYHSGEYRAPSFAELMRQLSYLDLKSPNYVPPYSQETLKGTCADKLIINDVWWK